MVSGALNYEGDDMKLRTPLHCLVSESGSRFIGHCLEYDLVVSADTYHEALRRLTFVVGAHVHTAEKSGGRMSLEHQAPEMFWRKFEALYGQHIHESVNGVLCEVVRSTSDAIQ
jgi:hypothetical protein